MKKKNLKTGKRAPELKRRKRVRVLRLVSRLLDDVPTNWLDPLLTGPDAALSQDADKWGSPDIECLLLRIKARMRKTVNASGELPGGE
jgi:hypothetical protein